VNTGAPLPGVDQAQERVLHYQRKLHVWARTHPMCSWRAGCGGTRTSGSEGGGEETTGRKANTGASPPTLRGWGVRAHPALSARGRPGGRLRLDVTCRAAVGS
jgi:hypothetical protein